MQVVEGGLGGLADFIESKAWSRPGAEVLLLARDHLSPEAWLYVFDADEFRQRAEELLREGVDVKDERLLADWFEIHENTAIAVIPFRPDGVMTGVGTEYPVPAVMLLPDGELGGVIVRTARPPKTLPPGISGPKDMYIGRDHPWWEEMRRSRDAASGTAQTAEEARDVSPGWKPDLRRRRRRGGDRGLDRSEELRFTPHLDVTPTPPLRPGERFDVEVYLDTGAAHSGETTEDFRMAPPPNVAELEVEVWLRSTSHFVIQGLPVGNVTIRLRDGVSSRARFSVRVADPVPDVGVDPGLSASFAYNLLSSGLVVRTIALALPDGLLQPGPPPAIRGGGAQIDPTSLPPDLRVEIHRRDGRDDLYDVEVRTADRVELGDWRLDGGSETYVKETMKRFFAKNASAQARRAELRGAGIEFFRRSPACFQKVYWELVDAGTPPKTIYVVSEERAVPWELMVPRRRRGDGSRDERAPLGAQFAIGRWHRESKISPRQHIPLSDSLVLAPRYTGRRRVLDHAEAEAEDVRARFSGQRVPATFDELDNFFREHHASLIHFICHGKDDTIQTILLEGTDELSAQQVAATGLADACEARRPLVFLNACEVGRPARGLAGVGGFAAAFIEEDASAVVAPLWAVDDNDAHQVATLFYEQLAANPGTPFAEILRGLRQRAYSEGGEDTFAAYCFYGDPGAAMVPAGVETAPMSQGAASP